MEVVQQMARRQRLAMVVMAEHPEVVGVEVAQVSTRSLTAEMAVLALAVKFG